MKTLSVTDVARNFRKVIDAVEHDQEEIVLVRNRKEVARLVPERPAQNALEVFGDLYRTLDDRAAKALLHSRVEPSEEPPRAGVRAEKPLGWLIDTSIWIAVERGQLSAADVHAVTDQEPVYLSPVNIAEIQFGVDMLPPGPLKQRATAALRRLRRKPQLRITVETGEVFRTLAARLKKAGREADFRINDLWLAAQTIQRGFTLLTSNPKDFEDIPKLEMVAVPASVVAIAIRRTA